MFTITRKTIEWGGRTLTLETGKVARQADGAVIATYGETSVLCTVVSAKEAKPDIDFFPLTVNYIEKFYAAGRIPGGFFKREGRATEGETLKSRLIDRPIRPLFDDNFRNETQIVCTVVSFDQENDPDVVAMIGTSAALAIAGVPFLGPIAGARVGYKDGAYLLNPTAAELEESALDLVVAGTADSVLMVESEAKELSEEVMLGAVNFGHEQFQPVIAMIQELADAAGKPRWAVKEKEIKTLYTKVKELAEVKLREAYDEKGKQLRVEKVAAVKQFVVEAILAENPEQNTSELAEVFKKLEKDIVRWNILDKGIRIDGRDNKTVRPIETEVGLLPKTHGSALFTRGETQALVVATLGTKDDEQIFDELSGERRENFLLHYNFPPYSVGEALPMRAPGRREVGHGKLAWRAIHPLVPTKEQFPYTLRVVSEITESNGSSSMATVCGTSLALMDAGVPMPRPIAGIAMGLIKEADKFAVLSDILGDEDHLGDMDFKVAGTSEGVTALQMDIKIKGITPQIMQIALEQAHQGRLHILSRMAESLSESRGALSKNAPTITTIKIDKDKIREVIGSGGKVIREICEVSGAKVDIEEQGQFGIVRVAAVNQEAGDIAIKMINDIVAEPEIGAIYDGKVVRIVDFGAFVSIMGSSKHEGLVHISEIADRRLGSVTEVLSEGEAVTVKVLDIDPRTKKIRLSIKAVSAGNKEGGEAAPQEEGGEGSSTSGQGGYGGNPKKPRRENRDHDRGDRGDRGDRDRGDRGERGDRDFREPRESRGEKEPRDFRDNPKGSGEQKRKKRFF